MDTGTAETTEDAPNLTADGAKVAEATEDTTGTQTALRKPQEPQSVTKPNLLTNRKDDKNG